MSRAERWLNDHRWIGRLRALADRPGKRQLGWGLLDGSAPTKLVWIHFRTFLAELGMPPGVRVELDPGRDLPLDLLASLRVGSRYKSLILSQPGEDLAPETLEFLVDARHQGQLWQVLEVGDDQDTAWLVGEEGRRVRLPESQPWSSAPPVMRFDHPEAVERPLLLPFDLRVSSRHARNLIAVSLPAKVPGLRHREHEFVVEDPGGEPLGEGVLRIDVRLRAGHPDELLPPIARAFARDVRVGPATPVSPLPYARKPLHLHVLFDRTTLDVDAWPEAAHTAEFGKMEHQGAQTAAAPGPSLGQAKVLAGEWNRQWRQALARDLPPSLPHLHTEVEVHLWWFADLPREGIAGIEGLEPTQSWGRWGEISLGQIEAVLSGNQFDYRPGLDVVDAVDEALAGIAESVQRGVETRNEQHAVLIVGDSPPPPAAPGDPTWTTLVDWPPRTNSRCSPLFGESLQRLRRQGARVGWLFVRNSRAPLDTRGYGELYGIYQAMKEQTLEALRIFGADLLAVGWCNGPEALGRGLVALFGRMVDREASLPRFRIYP